MPGPPPSGSDGRRLWWRDHTLADVLGDLRELDAVPGPGHVAPGGPAHEIPATARTWTAEGWTAWTFHGTARRHPEHGTRDVDSYLLVQAPDGWRGGLVSVGRDGFYDWSGIGGAVPSLAGLMRASGRYADRMGERALAAAAPVLAVWRRALEDPVAWWTRPGDAASQGPSKPDEVGTLSAWASVGADSRAWLDRVPHLHAGAVWRWREDGFETLGQIAAWSTVWPHAKANATTQEGPTPQMLAGWARAGFDPATDAAAWVEAVDWAQHSVPAETVAVWTRSGVSPAHLAWLVYRHRSETPARLRDRVNRWLAGGVPLALVGWAAAAGLSPVEAARLFRADPPTLQTLQAMVALRLAGADPAEHPPLPPVT